MSLQKNFLYNSILTVSKYLFPLIVYPYVSRTLGLSNIGIVNFIDNLVNYFVYISMMGITTVGVREIATFRSDKDLLSKAFISLLTLTAITTLIAIAALWIAMYTVSDLIPYQDLLYIGLIKLVFNLFLMEWFFMGIEDFRYITNRSIFVKCLYVACVFLFIREASDYKTYYVLSAGMVVVNALFNLFYIRKFVHWSFSTINLRPFYKSFLIMGIYVLLTNVYTSLNPVWLGVVTDTDQVGYFTTATKLHNIIMAVLLSFANILFPRVSNLLAEDRKKEYWEKIDTSFDAILLFAFPTIVFIVSVGPQLLHVLVGDGFEGSYLPLRIITPLTLIIGIEEILVIQILMSMRQDYTVLRNSLIGAIVALLLNKLLTANMGAVGSAIVWICAECAIMFISMYDVYRKYHYTIPYKRVLAYVVSYALLLLISVALCQYFDNEILLLGVVATLTLIYTGLNETFVMKNKVVSQTLLPTLKSLFKHS